ncbi:sulfate transporter family-domain-containing protein, partial [Blyttiomyces helicus]
YYIPVIGWLPNYDVRKYLQHDILAGVTVAFLLVPQGLSYAQALVKIPPVNGLYTAIFPLIVYAFLGTSRQLGVGPEALISILVGATIKEYSLKDNLSGGADSLLDFAEKSQHEHIAIASLLCLLVGLFTFLLGFFRLGFLDSVLSRALLRGFVLAVAVVVMIDMADTLLGNVPPVGQCGIPLPTTPPEDQEPESPIQKLLDTLSKLGRTHMLTATLSACSVAFLLGMRWLKKKFARVRWLQFLPEILILVVASTLLCQMLRWDCQGVAILNRVQGGDGATSLFPRLPQITIPKVKFLMLSAILISVIGFVESIVVAKTYAAKHDYAVSPNRELVALGLANIVASLFGAFPAFGSLGRSAVNDTAGAKTQLAGLFTGSLVLCAAIWLLPYLEFLPKAVCSSIIVVAALKLLDFEEVHFILRLRAWKDVGLLLMTFLTTIFVSIESGTLLSVGVSLLLVVKHTTKTRLAILGRTAVMDPISGVVKTKYRNIHEYGRVERIEGGLVIQVEEGLFFGNSGQLKDRLKRIELHGDIGVHPGEEPRRGTPAGSATSMTPRHPNVQEGIRSVIFDFGAVTDVDARCVFFGGAGP